MRRQSTNPSPRETRRHPDTTVVDHAWCLVVALARGKQHHGRCCGGQGAWNACRPSGGTVLLALSWIELGPALVTFISLAGIRRRRAGPVAELAGTRAVRLGAGWDLRYYRLADRRPLPLRCAYELPHRRASSFAVGAARPVGGGAPAGRFRVVPMLSGGESRHLARLGARDRVLADRSRPVCSRHRRWRSRCGVLPAGGRRLSFLSRRVRSSLFSLILPWGNATFLLAIITLFAWIASVAVRLATHHS